jgi:hypothetical protein
MIFNQHLTFGGLNFAVRIVFQSENVIRVDIMRAISRLFGKVVDSVQINDCIFFFPSSYYYSFYNLQQTNAFHPYYIHFEIKNYLNIKLKIIVLDR